jgi:hypothetical protein
MQTIILIGFLSNAADHIIAGELDRTPTSAVRTAR